LWDFADKVSNLHRYACLGTSVHNNYEIWLDYTLLTGRPRNVYETRTFL